MKTFAFFLLLTALPALANFQVVVTGLKNQVGHVRLIVFEKADGFPDDHSKAKYRLSLPAKSAKNGTLTFKVEAKSLQNCAFVALHDENSNKKAERNLIGIPKEGVAISRGVSIPPRFSKAVIKNPKSPLTLKVKYW